MTNPAPLAPMPQFSEFYEALNKREPFPWQARLAERVAVSGHWPAEIGVPTGLGKTACLDIAVWWLASQAARPPADRTAPTRIWWVVNRRLLVDSTADHATKISDALKDSDLESLQIVSRRLRSIADSPGSSPLEVIRLRGGVASTRPTDPSCPAVILSTIPMYGSRLLFRGYGTSRTMRSVDAALAGTDSLVLVDEAHLARHLTNLISQLAASVDGAEEILGKVRTHPQVVALTATGDAKEEDRFDLDADDELNEIVRQRLDATKAIEVRVHTRHSEKHLATAAERLLRGAKGAACLVFANSPVTARAAWMLLRKRFPTSVASTLLLTGRTREREAASIRKRVLDGSEGMAADRSLKAVRKRHLIVVATQTLEVGADIDAEFLVTETCGVRALTQRLGRLNRLGRFKQSRGTYVHMPPPRRKGAARRGPIEWPVYGREPDSVRERLEDAVDPNTGVVNLSPRNISEVLGEPGDDPGRAPEILKGLLWEWVKTTTPPPGEAPVEPYFAGIAGVDYSVSVIWRAHVPEPGWRLWPRPSNDEIMSIPIGDFRDVLDSADEVRRLGPDQMTIELSRTEDLQSGNVVVLPSDSGLLDEFGWNPSATGTVFDMSVPVRGLPLEEDAIRRLVGVSLSETVSVDSNEMTLSTLLKGALGDVEDHEDPDEARMREAAEQLRQELSKTRPEGWEESEWSNFLDDLGPPVVSLTDEVPRLPCSKVSSERRQNATLLHQHGERVGKVSESLSERIGVPLKLVRVIARAGRWHDCGKADSRFQRWLNPAGSATNGESSPPLAKSKMPRSRWNATRVAAGWPRGGRHEALSARLVRAWVATVGDEDPLLADLLVHLVASHHGSGRPLIPPATDGAMGTVVAEIEGVQLESGVDLSVVDWEQPARFRRLNDRFGPWGLALMETIVRQADYRVSSEEASESREAAS